MVSFNALVIGAGDFGKNSGFFGLELPMAVVAMDMMQVEELHDRTMEAVNFEFIWQARDRGDNNVIDDLALHPWSLIPPQFKTKSIGVFDKGNQADIRVDLQNPISRKTVPCRILLEAGGT